MSDKSKTANSSRAKKESPGSCLFGSIIRTLLASVGDTTRSEEVFLSGMKQLSWDIRSKLPSKLIGLFRIPASFGHGRSSAAITKHHPLIIKIDVADKGLIVSAECLKRPVIFVPCNGKRIPTLLLWAVGNRLPNDPSQRCRY